MTDERECKRCKGRGYVPRDGEKVAADDALRRLAGPGLSDARRVDMRVVGCPACETTGVQGDDWVTCWACADRGVPWWIACRACWGGGLIPPEDAAAHALARARKA